MAAAEDGFSDAESVEVARKVGKAKGMTPHAVEYAYVAGKLAATKAKFPDGGESTNVEKGIDSHAAGACKSGRKDRSG